MAPELPPPGPRPEVWEQSWPPAACPGQGVCLLVGDDAGAEGAPLRTPPAPETHSPGGPRAAPPAGGGPAPVHKAPRVASHGPSAAWHPPAGPSCRPVPRNDDTRGAPRSSALARCCSSAAQSCPTLRPRGLQHARLPCPPLPPGICSDSGPLTCDATSVVPFSSCPPSFPASGSFPMRQFFASGEKSIAASASTSALPVSIQD